ncbi:hypothetical protein GCM10010411_95110 [Actinomadura fulvescens]|uniref:Ketoreductase domain-containing protein n=2 Tax=Actinomadura fulvescens TaxID=46160 RepID=A0ABN3R038_9ACTN
MAASGGMTFGDAIWRASAHLDPYRHLSGLRTRRRLEAVVAGKRILVTGASEGIGRLTALALATPEAELVLVARRGEALAAVAAEVEERGGIGRMYPCDLTDEPATAALAAQMIDLGGVDILINNAGHLTRKDLADTGMTDLRYMMALNYFGALALTMPLVAHMRAGSGGHVINVSSIGVQIASVPRFHGYLASKAALDAFARAAAAETRRDGVHWTSVRMPLVRTRMIDRYAAYRRFPVMSAESAAQVIVQAVVRRPVRLSHPVGMVAHLAGLAAPRTVERIAHHVAPWV